MNTVVKKKIVPTLSLVNYTNGDVVGGLQTIQIGKYYSYLTLIKAFIIDLDNIGHDFEFYLFDDIPTSFADNTAFLPTHADYENMMGSFAVDNTDYVSYNGTSFANISINEIVTHDDTIYLYIVDKQNTLFSATDDLIIKLFFVEQ